MNIFNEKLCYVIIDTQNYLLARCALEHSQSQFELSKVWIFSDDEKMWPGYEIVKIPKINSLSEYNHFVLSELHKYIETEFCLIIQYDGFVIDGSMFAKLFLEYDYIGAVWPHYEQYNVGCGGMSLRSKKLLSATTKFAENLADFETPEDLIICRYHRTLLEQEFQIRFAPPAVANHFSEEMMAQPWSTFSFHGPAFLPRLYANQIEFLFENLSPQSEIKIMALERACAKVGPRAMRALEAFRRRTDADRERNV